MSEERLIEVFCKAEGVVTGVFRTAGKLDERAMRQVETRDPKRYPVRIQNGEQLLCLECSQPLYFRDGEGNLIAALPGSAEVCEDPGEVRKREQRADQALRDEAAGLPRRNETYPGRN